MESEDFLLRTHTKDTGGSAARVPPLPRLSAPVSPSDRTAREIERLRRDKNGPLRRVIFNKHENTPKTGKFSGYFRAIGVPALPAKRARTATPSLVQRAQPFGAKPRALRLEAIHITREHRSLADVVQPSSCMVRRSRPMPRPPCGGMPYLCSMVKDSNSLAFILRASSLSICS